MPVVGLTVSCSLLPLGLGSSIVLVFLLEWMAPDVIPFQLTTFWTVPDEPGSAVTGALGLIWPVLVTGLLATILGVLRTRPLQRKLAQLEPTDGLITLTPYKLLVNSVLEEVFFRWLIFFAAIATVRFADFIILGFADLHPIRWVFQQALIPVADLATWHQLHEVLTGQPWMVGAAMLTSNSRFRKGHFYQGLFGLVWSWYLGMFLFLIMFDYGLPLAIAVHLGYNLLIMAVHLALVGTLPRLRIADDRLSVG
ncbi:hypothetical protein [Actinomadura sp. 9N215]|uniref:hypothetical protein n=1 Tax=Actinomadura sp. 9N215 TaxID=3375150 RepID=UPI0037B90CB8